MIKSKGHHDLEATTQGIKKESQNKKTCFENTILEYNHEKQSIELKVKDDYLSTIEARKVYAILRKVNEKVKFGRIEVDFESNMITYRVFCLDKQFLKKNGIIQGYSKPLADYHKKTEFIIYIGNILSQVVHSIHQVISHQY